jgi:restriction system protein
MAIWLIRAGRYGEREDFALQNHVAVIGWSELPDLSGVKEREQLATLLEKHYPDSKLKTRLNWESQIWPFISDIKVGDMVAMPLKHRAIIAFGEVTSEYRYETEYTEGYKHTRSVKWTKEIARNQFDQDLLYSLGSAMTICKIRRNDAENRIKAILAGKKLPSSVGPIKPEGDDEDGELRDLAQDARDQISQTIMQKFKGHGLARLTGAVLQAQGYQVRVSPEGPDGGVDILAGRGPLGFESPKLIVQVKSQGSPVDVNVLRALNGIMNNYGADSGLIVAWGGYQGKVESEAVRQFFKIRLWDADELVQMIQENYDNLPKDIQAELPLKRIWILVSEEEE